MNLQVQQNAACESRPGNLKPCHWCVWIVLECGIHVNKLDFSSCCIMSGFGTIILQKQVNNKQYVYNFIWTSLYSFKSNIPNNHTFYYTMDRERNREMEYTVLFFLLILTATQATSLHHHCNSDVYSSASGMADPQRLTTLQYCLNDNCTIIRIDTGEQLDIVYTTQSHLVVTPTDGQTSMFISKNDPELFCSTPNTIDNTTIIQQVAGIIVRVFAILVCASIIAVHLIFKEFLNTFGKLLVLYNIGLIVHFLCAMALTITHYNIALNSAMPCYLIYFLFMQSIVVGETSATCFLAYLAYIMYHSYRSREVTKEMNKKFYKYAIMYLLALLLLFDIFVVSYDFGTGTYKNTLLPNGHCSFFVEAQYDTIIKFLDVFAYINEIIKILSLVTYFVYYYKFNKLLTIVRRMPSTDTQQNRLFLKIAIMMAANLGISQMAYPSATFFGIEALLHIASFFFVIQQCVILLLFVCSKKMSQLCKEKFCSTETSS